MLLVRDACVQLGSVEATVITPGALDTGVAFAVARIVTPLILASGGFVKVIEGASPLFSEIHGYVCPGPIVPGPIHSSVIGYPGAVTGNGYVAVTPGSMENVGGPDHTGIIGAVVTYESPD